MIAVIAAFPTKQNEKDGMLQRVSAIDSLITEVDRIYIDIAIRRYKKMEIETVGKATIYRLNVCLHFFMLSRLLRQADTVYVHSAYNALKILPFLSRIHLIFDAHGIVPEELELEGQRFAPRLLAYAESVAVRNCSVLVSVTERMRRHYEKKYRRHGGDNIVFPILPNFDTKSTPREDVFASKRYANSVIYAGGLQAWQNIDKMIDSAIRRRDMKYTFLSGDTARFKDKLAQKGLINFDCLSVPPSDVKDYYLTHTYGFILRDAIAVNEVACPTKLIEYLYWGVIPIVITPEIGDFDGSNIRTVLLSQFINGDMPSEEDQHKMRELNRKTIDSLILSAEHSRQRLMNLLTAS